MGMGVGCLCRPRDVAWAPELRREKSSGQNCLIFLVRAFEIRELVIRFEMPNPGSDFIDQIMIVRH